MHQVKSKAMVAHGESGPRRDGSLTQLVANTPEDGRCAQHVHQQTLTMTEGHISP